MVWWAAFCVGGKNPSSSKCLEWIWWKRCRFSLQRLLNKSFCKDGGEKGKEKGETACPPTHHPPSHRTRVSLKNYWPPSSSSTCPSETSVRWSHSWRRSYTCAWINLRQQQSTTNILAEIPRPVWLYFSALDSGWKSSGSWRKAGAGDPRRVQTPQPGPASVQLEKNVFLPLPLSQTGDFVEAASQKASSSFRCRQEVGGHLQNKSRIELRLKGAKRQQSLMENRLIFVVSMLNM